jgi:8-oxo-dGTP pyrophosphatase MutT (NUDIX family)
MADPAPFSAEGFRRRVAACLAPGAVEGLESGDHRFSPDIVHLFRDIERRRAAVLVPVVAREGEATVLLTQRAEHLAAHPGQVAFPGGKIDAGETAEQAALREAEEEIGLEPRFVEVIGRGPDYLTGSGFRIAPVIALVTPGFTLRLNAEEVGDAFEVPLAFLMDPANHRRGSRVWQGATRAFVEMPYRDRHIWGVTAGILHVLHERLYGAENEAGAAA